MAVKITQNGIDTLQDNIIDSSKIVNNSISVEDLPSGCDVQTVKLLSTARASWTIPGSSDGNCPNMSLTVTPKLSGSKFLVRVRVFLEVDNSWDVVWNIKRDGTRINAAGQTINWFGLSMAMQTYGAAENNDSTPEFLDFVTLDETGSTAGTPFTYQLVASSNGTNRTCFINSDWNNDPRNGHEYGTSEIIVTEIKG
jgi:hypothetical protein